MIRNLADKFGRRTSPKPAPGTKPPATGAAQSPSASMSSASASTSAPSYDHRPSDSTERTSVSAWSKQQDTMDVDAPRIPLQVRRPTGSYRLTDFIIHRTLGTGSFGRVHLGQYSIVCCVGACADSDPVASAE